MELFHEKFFFCKIHKKTPVPESLFNKVIGLYPAISLKERTPTEVFSDDYCKIFKTPFFRAPPGHCFCSTEKYFTNKWAKNPLRKEKNGNSLHKKQRHTRNKNLITIYIKPLYPFTIQKLFFSVFSASQDILKTQVFRINAIPLRIYLL